MEPNNRFDQEQASYIPTQSIPTKKGRKNALLVATIAIIVAVGLIALAAMAYLGKIKPADNTPASTQQSTTPSDVEATATDLENAVKDLDSDQDFSSDELSDNNLEL